MVQEMKASEGKRQRSSARLIQQQVKEAQGQLPLIGSTLGKGTIGTWVGFVESKKELTAAFFCGAEVKPWEIPFTAGGRDLGKWMGQEVSDNSGGGNLSRRQTEGPRGSIAMFTHGTTHWEWEGQVCSMLWIRFKRVN